MKNQLYYIMAFKIRRIGFKSFLNSFTGCWPKPCIRVKHTHIHNKCDTSWAQTTLKSPENL